MANVDCDGDGQTNTVECTNNTDPGDPCSNTYTSAQICTYVIANPRAHWHWRIAITVLSTISSNVKMEAIH
ncbi:MAG: hypothetical protein IPH96_13260 [Saprospiraceae bacterium]|nr:hypothetical protein [Saprospiraceae bacterium]